MRKYTTILILAVLLALTSIGWDDYYDSHILITAADVTAAATTVVNAAVTTHSTLNAAHGCLAIDDVTARNSAITTHSNLTTGIHGATATKTASRIPITDANGLLNSWSSAAATLATTGTMTVNMNNSNVITITPTGACTFNASGGVAGQRQTFIVTTSGTVSYILTFGTNFKSAGTLTTGTTSGKVFCVDFVCKDGTTWTETGRTAAM